MKKNHQGAIFEAESPTLGRIEMSMQIIRKLVAITLLGLISPLQATATDSYSIQAISFGHVKGINRSFFVEGEQGQDKIDIPFVIWLLKRHDKVVLFDAGYFRESWTEQWNTQDFVSPDIAVKKAGVAPEDVTDIIISHMHWDHAQGALLFPNANVWVQEDEYTYYTGEAWQKGGDAGGVDKRDVEGFVKLNLEGRLKFVKGDNVEVLPGIKAYTGGKHTFQSQYIRVDGEKPIVLASDNAYLFQNIETQTPINKNATFSVESNRVAIKRMIELAGDVSRVLPGHDPLIFERYPTKGHVATIRD